MTDCEIIELLGGVTAVARMLDIKPPSVHGWIKDGIPDGRLRDLAGQIEARSGGRFSRRERWPDKFAFYWPELATAPAAVEKLKPDQLPAAGAVHEADAQPLGAGRAWAGPERRASRKANQHPDLERRAPLAAALAGQQGG